MTRNAGSSRALGAVLLVCAAALRAATIDEDEVRIEALIEAEHAAARAIAAAAVPSEPPTAVAAPAPVVAQAVAPSPDAISNDDWLAPDSAANRGLRFDELATRVGSKVAIVTVGERVHRGIVAAADARGLTLRVPRAGSGGGAVYTLKREQIARIDLR